VISHYQYDAQNRLDVLRHFTDNPSDGVDVEYTQGVDTLLAEYDYAVRDDGKRTSAVETDPLGRLTRTDWQYDNLGRLVEEAFDDLYNPASPMDPAAPSDPGTTSPGSHTTWPATAPGRPSIGTPGKRTRRSSTRTTPTIGCSRSTATSPRRSTLPSHSGMG
jgi:hypothetical protein